MAEGRINGSRKSAVLEEFWRLLYQDDLSYYSFVSKDAIHPNYSQRACSLASLDIPKSADVHFPLNGKHHEAKSLLKVARTQSRMAYNGGNGKWNEPPV
jgi:hypothetical protein